MLQCESFWQLWVSGEVCLTPHGKEEGLMAFNSNSSLIYYLPNNCLLWAIAVQPFPYWVSCPDPMESSAHLPTSCLVVPISIATQEIHHRTYVVSYVVGHNALKLHQENEVLPFLEDSFLHTENFREIVLDVWVFLIDYCT